MRDFTRLPRLTGGGAPARWATARPRAAPARLARLGIGMQEVAGVERNQPPRPRWAHDGRRVQAIPSHTYFGGLIRVSPLPRSLLRLRNEGDDRTASRHHSRRAIARLALFTGAHPAPCSHGDMPTRKQWPSFPAGRGRPWPAVGSLPVGRKVPDPSWRSYSSMPSATAVDHSG